MAFSPFFGPTFNCIIRVLTRHKIKTACFPPRKITSLLQPIKDNLVLKTPGICNVLYECGKVFIETPSSNEDLTTFMEHSSGKRRTLSSIPVTGREKKLSP
jgi:hypothetical protein